MYNAQFHNALVTARRAHREHNPFLFEVAMETARTWALLNRGAKKCRLQQESWQPNVAGLSRQP